MIGDTFYPEDLQKDEQASELLTEIITEAVIRPKRIKSTEREQNKSVSLVSLIYLNEHRSRGARPLILLLPRFRSLS